MDAYQTTLYHAVLTASLVLGILLLYGILSGYRTNRRYFRRQRELDREKEQLQEEERQRIAHDLHDELGPLLSLTQLQLRRGIKAAPHPQLEAAATGLQEAALRLQGIARNLTPTTLLHGGLREALAQFTDQCSRSSGTRFELRYEVARTLPAPMEVHLFRMVQELAHNTLKHASAPNAVIHFKEQDDALYLWYRDDGRGLPPALRTGIGLHSLSSRVAALRGILQPPASGPGGTEFFIQIPLSYETDPDRHC